ncbi:MAG: amino acid ABC transporter permease [Candidatus Dependentiae bacterium]|nr:amino acid ABC transporter permease [Candidatus Dependentiae bacterium]
MNLSAYFSLICQGIVMTFAAWICAGLFSLIIGTLLGILSCRRLATSWSSVIIRTYTFIAKGIPAYVQILIAYFVIPAALGLKIPAFLAAVGALVFCSSGYVTEIVRSGINTVSVGQWDACFVLGYSMPATLRRIILPQALKNIMPALFGEFEQLLKTTSLLATIGITELTRSGMNIISRELNPIPVYCMVACIYLIFSGVLQLVMIYIERKGLYGNNR